MKANCVSPIFHVSDLCAAIDFYHVKLGFDKEFVYGKPPYYAGVKLGDVILHLNQGDEGKTRRGQGTAYVFCDSVDEYYREIEGRGTEITSKLNAWPYGMRDFQIADPDGNRVCFGCPVDCED